MNKPITKLIILLLIISFCSSCNTLFNNRRLAYKQIGDMKEQPVLVRLRATSDEESKYNQDIIDAFNEEFLFTTYYFFESNTENYEAIRSKDYNNVQFTDKDGNVMKSFSFLENGFFIITMDGAYETHFVRLDENGQRTPSGGTERKPGAAVLDGDFVQLIMPFPYKSFWKPSHDRNDYHTMVRSLNYKLDNFYKANYAKVDKYREFKPVRPAYEVRK